MVRQLPEGWTARYDYHEHPRGLSAVLFNQVGDIQGVGFAKFNPRDGEFRHELGRRIALGRALKAATIGKRNQRWFFPSGAVLDGRGLTVESQRIRDPEALGRSIADELVMVPTD